MATFGDDRLPARFWSRVVVDANGCWTWTGATTGKGYGVATLDGKLRLAHRWVYHRLVAPVDQETARGQARDHVHHAGCRNTLCVNPAHLEARPAGEHLGHGHRDKTTCPSGHPYDEANTLVRANGWRSCRACARDRTRRRRADRRAP